MSTIAEFATAMDEAFQRIGTAVDGLTADIKALDDKITVLQGSEVLSEEDKAQLAGIKEHAAAIADKLAALDAATETSPVASLVPTPAEASAPADTEGTQPE